MWPRPAPDPPPPIGAAVAGPSPPPPPPPLRRRPRRTGPRRAGTPRTPPGGRGSPLSTARPMHGEPRPIGPTARAAPAGSRRRSGTGPTERGPARPRTPPPGLPGYARAPC
eukprot:6518065-Pyramimonas_sp.AAC.3